MELISIATFKISSCTRVVFLALSAIKANLCANVRFGQAEYCEQNGSSAKRRFLKFSTLI